MTDHYRLALDFDGVLCDLRPAITWALREAGYHVNGLTDRYDCIDWALEQGIEKDAVIRIVNFAYEYCDPEHYPPMKENIEWVKANLNPPTKFFVLTARNNLVYPRRWLDHFGLKNGMLLGPCNGEAKANMMRCFHLTGLVDDYWMNLFPVRDKGLQAFLQKQPYNEKYWEQFKSINSLSDLNEEVLY